jgi:phosphatidylglycerol---prolipoprotein diacylglyceryl transferase
MIPYVIFESFRVGPLTVHVWGLFVAVGILAGTVLAARRARDRGLAPDRVVDVAFWVVVAGFIGARLWFLLEYGREVGLNLGVLRVQDGGLSATGGILGGLVAAGWYLRSRRIPLARFADSVAPGLLVGESVGRLGCFLIHDHLGRPTSFPFSVVVNGMQRHDVGLELSVAALLGMGVLLLTERLGVLRRPGSAGLFALLWYAGTRLVLDFLRANDLPVVDRRYAGLTLAQYAAIVGIIVGIIFVLRLRRTPYAYRQNS